MAHHLVVRNFFFLYQLHLDSILSIDNCLFDANSARTFLQTQQKWVVFTLRARAFRPLRFPTPVLLLRGWRPLLSRLSTWSARWPRRVLPLLRSASFSVTLTVSLRSRLLLVCFCSFLFFSMFSLAWSALYAFDVDLYANFLQVTRSSVSWSLTVWITSPYERNISLLKRARGWKSIFFRYKPDSRLTWVTFIYLFQEWHLLMSVLVPLLGPTGWQSDITIL